MPYRKIQIEIRNETAWIYFNNPEKLNAISADMVDTLLEKVKELEENSTVRIAILKGKGVNFSTGANLEELEKFTPEEALTFHRKMNDISHIMRHSRKIYMAVFEGYSLGGAFELSLSTDIRVCDENATMGQPEIKVGLNAGAGGNAILPLMIGKGNAMFMALTGRTITAQRALELGIVQAVFPAARLNDELDALITGLLKRPQATLEAVKHTVNEATNREIDSLMEKEAQAFSYLHSKKEVKKEIRKFLKK